MRIWPSDTNAANFSHFAFSDTSVPYQLLIIESFRGYSQGQEMVLKISEFKSA